MYLCRCLMRAVRVKMARACGHDRRRCFLHAWQSLHAGTRLLPRANPRHRACVLIVHGPRQAPGPCSHTRCPGYKALATCRVHRDLNILIARITIQSIQRLPVCGSLVWSTSTLESNGS
jgi:hypothetical protein